MLVQNRVIIGLIRMVGAGSHSNTPATATERLHINCIL